MAGVRQNGGFFRVPNSAFDLGLSLYELGVYCYLLRCASSEGEAFPSYASMAARTGMTKRKAMQAVARLIDLGLLEIVERGDPRRQRANRYRVRWPSERSSPPLSRSSPKAADPPGIPQSPSLSRASAQCLHNPSERSSLDVSRANAKPQRDPSERSSPALVNQGNPNNTHNKNTHKEGASRKIGASSKRGLEIEEGFQGKREEERGKTFFAKFAEDKGTVIRSASLKASEKGTVRETPGPGRFADALAVPTGYQAHPAGSSGFVRFEAFAEGLSGPEVVFMRHFCEEYRKRFGEDHPVCLSSTWETQHQSLVGQDLAALEALIPSFFAERRPYQASLGAFLSRYRQMRRHAVGE